MANSQRSRLLAALVDQVATHGFAATSVKSVVRSAGVSPNVFYQQFPDKEACFFAAYEVFVRSQLKLMKSVPGNGRSGQEMASARIRAVLELLEREPRAARTFLIEAEAAGLAFRSRRRAVEATYAKLMLARYERLRKERRDLSPLSDLTFRSLISAARCIVCDALDTSPEPALSELTGPIAQLLSLAVPLHLNN